MKIIIDSRLILPHQTGIGRYLLGLIRSFGSQSNDVEFECWLQSNLPVNHPIWSLSKPNVFLRKLPVPHMSIRQQWEIPLKVMNTPHDIFHYPHFDLPFAVPRKTLVTIYDIKYLAHPDFFPHLAKMKRVMMKLMMYNATHRAQRVITISNHSRNDLIRQFHIPADKIEVTYLGVEQKYFEKSDPAVIETFRRKHSLQDPFILFVGERRPHKNITGVIRAFQLFTTMVKKPYRLIIAGKAYLDYREPERLVEDLGLSNRISFLDSPTDDEVHWLFQSAEVLMLLSRYEGFGLPLLEAMASGTPVIAANATSLPEIVGGAGEIVPLDDPTAGADAIRQNIIGGENREMNITRGYDRARSFTWDNCANQTIQIYRQLQHTGS